MNDLPLKEGDRILYRRGAGQSLHEGLIREVSRVAYKVLTDQEGTVWLDKGSVRVVELLPNREQEGDKDDKKSKRKVSHSAAALNDAGWD